MPIRSTTPQSCSCVCTATNKATVQIRAAQKRLAYFTSAAPRYGSREAIGLAISTPSSTRGGHCCSPPDVVKVVVIEQLGLTRRGAEASRSTSRSADRARQRTGCGRHQVCTVPSRTRGVRAGHATPGADAGGVVDHLSSSHRPTVLCDHAAARNVLLGASAVQPALRRTAADRAPRGRGLTTAGPCGTIGARAGLRPAVIPPLNASPCLARGAASRGWQKPGGPSPSL
jgi:hypothetical protein